jgi:hypothetical protein
MLLKASDASENFLFSPLATWKPALLMAVFGGIHVLVELKINVDLAESITHTFTKPASY